jgi:hypothetical protein
MRRQSRKAKNPSKLSALSKQVQTWLWPNRQNLFCRARLLAGGIGNLALGIYLFPRSDHLLDIQNYRYVNIDFSWVWIVTAAPAALLVIQMPILLSKSRVYWWLGCGLCGFPASLAFFELIQFPWL